MPVVPVAEARATLAPLADRRAAPTATPEQFGATQGRALQRLGGATGQVADALGTHALRLQEREDTAAVRDAYIAFDAQVQKLLLDPENGLYNRKGRDAKGVGDEAAKQIDELERNATGALRRPRQQELFRARTATLKSQHLATLTRYEYGELRNADLESTKAVLGSTIQGAVGAYRSPELREEYRAQGLYELDRLAQLHGWSPEQKAIERAKYNTLMHKGVIDRMLVEDPSGAKEYYEKHQGEINGETRTELEKSLQSGVTRERARSATEAIVSSGGGLSDWLAKARQIDDATLSDEVVRRVKERYNEQEAMRAKVERDAKDAAWQTVMGAGSLDAVPPHIMSKLDGYTIISMQNYIDKQGNPTTDPAVFYELSQQAANDPESFAKANLLDHRHQLSNSDFQQAVGWQRSVTAALKGDEAKDNEVKRIGTVQQQLTATMDRMGLPRGKEGYETRGTFQQVARAALKRETDAKGRDLSETEVDEVLGRLALKGEVRSGKWFQADSDAFAFEVEGTEQESRFIAVPFDDIPVEQRQQAAEALKAKGLPVTEDAIEKLHTRVLLRGR